MKAINQTLGDCRKGVIDEIRRNQKSKKAWWANRETGINRIFAKKDKLVGILKTSIYWAKLAEDGGTKRPHAGHKSIAIPTEKVPVSRRKAGGARIMANQKKTFFKRGGLYRKKGPKKARIVEKLFTFVKSANITPWLRFKRTAEKIARRKFPDNFRYWLKRALKTAR